MMVAEMTPDEQAFPMDTLIHGDALAVLKTFPDCCIDALVVDPPAGISFMGRNFDSDRGGRDLWIVWLRDIMAEALRALKPGGHAFVWALPRTSHWTATALEDAGFEIRDCVVHLQSQGFPKSHDVSKAIDRMAGKEREVIGKPAMRSAFDESLRLSIGDTGSSQCAGRPSIVDITAPATPEAQRWQGWGSALKPSSEHWWLCRKPLERGLTIAQNVLTWGTGALNIDACRIAGNVPSVPQPSGKTGEMYGFKNGAGRSGEMSHPHTSGRWPANVVFSHSLWCDEAACADGCPVKLLDEQSGIRKSGIPTSGTQTSTLHTYGQYKKRSLVGGGDTGTASRFFQTFPPDPFIYQSKPSRRERNAGCEDLPEMQGFDKNTSKQIAHINHATGETTYNDYQPSANTNNHPCVKSISLMRYLIRLITPDGGIVLDCFAGSGSTLVAAIREGVHFIGIEEDADYVTITRARIAHALLAVEV